MCFFDEFGKWFGRNVQHKVVTIKNYVPDDFFSTTQVEYEKREKSYYRCWKAFSCKKIMRFFLKAWAKLHANHPDWSVEIYGVGPQFKNF